LNKKISYTFFKTFTLFIIIFLLVSTAYIKNLNDIYSKETTNSIESELDLKIANIQNNFEILKKDTLYISYIYKLNKNKYILKDEISSLIALKESYLEVYFLKNNGKKFLEINDNNLSKDIQEKKYLNDLKKLERGDIYVSPIKLLKDKEKIINPAKPYIEIITPVYDKYDVQDGFVVIDYSLNDILITFSNSKFDLETLIINKNNYILNSQNSKYNFGFIFNKDMTFNNIHKDIYKEIGEYFEGTLKNDNYYINVKKTNITSWLNENKQPNPFELRFITRINNNIIDKKIDEYLNTIAWIVFLYFLVALFISFIFAEYKRTEKENKSRLKISNNVFENSHDGIIITNKENKVLQVNKSFTKITGYSEKEILHKTPKILKSTGYHTKQFYKNMWDSLNNENYWEGEITNIKKNGTPYTEELTISRIYTDEDEFYHIASFVDITEAKRNKKTIEDKLEENKTYLEIINDYLITVKVDINGKILDVSDAFCRICGYAKEEVIGQNHNIFRHPDTTKEFYLNIWDDIYSGKTWEGEIKNMMKNKEVYYVHAKISPMYNNKTITGYASVAVDITDKKRIEEMSITDELTQTYNRRYFNMTIEKEILRAKRDNKTMGFAILDIDFFKQYNDTYGHNKGDKALIETANCIKYTVSRASDYIFRLGGEEFGILVTDINEKNFTLLLEKLRTNVEDLHIEHTNSTLLNKELTISIGGIVFDSNNLTAEKAYKRADKFLYEAKENGRNKVVIQTDDSHISHKINSQRNNYCIL